MGQARIDEAVDFNKLLAGFPKLGEARLPLHNIKVKLSTVVYRNPTDTWHPANFGSGLPDYSKAFYKFNDLNRDDKLLLILTAHQQGVDWLDSKEIYQLTWRIIVVFWDTRLNLLFINHQQLRQLVALRAAGKSRHRQRGPADQGGRRVQDL
jgi:hypothetical protein